jgi:thiamine pyrophosphokinase
MLDQRYDALILANGTPPPRDLFQILRKRCDKIIALDGGLNLLRRWSARPDDVIGDLDSAAASALKWAKRNGAAVHPQPSQESADIEKGFALCRNLKLKKVLVAGADGDALDHVLNAISVAAASRGLRLAFVTRSGVAHVLRGKVRVVLKIPRGHTLSWFGCPQAGPCTLHGVVWPFEGQMLKIGAFNSLSNLPVSGGVTLSQASGASLLVVSLRPKTAKT